MRDASTVEGTTLVETAAAGSHAGQVGVFLRADAGVHPQRGLVLLPGLSYGWGDVVEVAAAAFIGSHPGALAGGRAFFASGALKPNVSLAGLLLAPRKAEGDGRELRPGVQLGAGLHWDPSRHLGFSADLTGTFFPGAAADFGRAWLVPSLAVQGRL
jgi:hypothetical protein